MSTPAPDHSPTCWSLGGEIESVGRDAMQQRNRVGRMLWKSAEVRVVVVGMAKGVTWPQHTANGRVLVRVERGSIELRTTADCMRLDPGVLVALEPREPHEVVALDDSAFLLLVSGCEIESGDAIA